MRLLRITLCLSLSICVFGKIHSQITTNEKPMSLQLGFNDATRGTLGINKIIDIPKPDMNKINIEDAVNDRNQDKAQRIGVRIAVNYNSDNDGDWTVLSNGDKLWVLTLKVQDAQTLDLTFSKFWLPQKSKFFVYNPSTYETIGAITSKYLDGDKNHPDRFSTGLINGNTITLEYYQPADIKIKPVIEISNLYYGYRTYLSFDKNLGFGNSSGECQVDVNCSEGQDWQNEKNAIACILIKKEGGSYWCSGSLVNNTRNDSLPLFLTANHCMKPFDAINNSNASDCIFYWGYEAMTCKGGPSFLIKSTRGATVIANGEADFSLLKLLEDPRNLPGFTPYYLGWDCSDNNSSNGVCIHHPSKNVKKISTYTSAPILSKSGVVGISSGPKDYWKVIWSETVNGYGTTEKGSSGSPLFNWKHQVMGQLTGGNSGCNNLKGTDQYGRTYVSWTGNNNSDPRRRLSNWLDPLNTGKRSISGSLPISISGPSSFCEQGVFTIDDLPPNATASWRASSNGLTIISGQGTSSAIFKKEFSDCCNIYADIIINGKIRKTLTLHDIIIGTPDIFTMYIRFLMRSGGGEYWKANVAGSENIFSIEECDSYCYYDHFEAKLYQINKDFSRGKQVDYNPNFGSGSAPFQGHPEGFYLMEIRGFNSCGATEWCEIEVQYVDIDTPHNPELQVDYDPIGENITIRHTISSIKSDRLKRFTTNPNSLYEIQLWNNTAFIKSYKTSQQPYQISVNDLPRGIYIIKVIKDSKVYSRKFIKK